jgi:periplasmic copper chaperone A
MPSRVLAAVVFLLAGSTAAVAEPSVAGGVTIAKAWARATPGGARNGVVYMAITAEPGAADRLVAARSDAARSAELHTHIHEGDVIRMRRLDALDVRPGQPTVLRPGGHHLMLVDLKQPLKAGDRLKLTLVFEKAGEIVVEASIEPIGSSGPPGFELEPRPASDRNGSGSHRH